VIIRAGLDCPTPGFRAGHPPPGYMRREPEPPTMGDDACYRDYCPECDLQVTVVDEECPECGASLPTE